MATKVLELRIHGVSNTPPAGTLGTTATPIRIVGDDVTGFYRTSDVEPGKGVIVEAYSWGQLTSGKPGEGGEGERAKRDLQRGLWMLLLPFALGNVALFARPDVPADPAKERLRTSAGLNAWLIRVFCLGLTVTLALAATGVGADLVGWQCRNTACLGRLPGPWEFLASGWWAVGARPVAVGLLAPVVVLVAS